MSESFWEIVIILCENCSLVQLVPPPAADRQKILARLQKKRGELHKWSNTFEWIERNDLWCLSALFILISFPITSVSQRGSDRCVYSKVGADLVLLRASSETELLSRLHNIYHEDIFALTNLIKVTHLWHVQYCLYVSVTACRVPVCDGKTSVCHPKRGTTRV